MRRDEEYFCKEAKLGQYPLDLIELMKYQPIKYTQYDWQSEEITKPNYNLGEPVKYQ